MTHKPAGACRNLLSAAVFVLLAATAAKAADFNYSINPYNPGTIKITGYNGSDLAVPIPASIDGLTVTDIGEESFSYLDITSVSIPNTVTNIEMWAFNRCDELTNINVATDNTFYGSLDGILFNKAFSTIVRCPGGLPGDYVVPTTVSRIEDAAFDHCVMLDSITISSNVTSIGNGVFASCWNLDQILTDAANSFFCSVDGVLFNKTQTVLVQCPGSRSGHYDVPGTVTSIGGGAFDHCPIDSVAMPDGVTSIGHRAFRACLSMTNIAIPSGVKTLGDEVFAYCYGLTNIAIPAGVTSIGQGAFSQCEGLTNIDVSPANTAYSSADGVLFNKERTTLITCPGGKPGAYSVPPGVTVISDRAFAFCANLTRISLPAGVASLGFRAFECCPGLASIEIPAAVANIDQEAFKECENLQGVFFEGDAPGIGWEIFNETASVVVYYLPGTSGWSDTFAGRVAMLWNPVISSPLRSEGTNGFVFTVTGTTNIPVVVQARTSLVSGAWIILHSNVVSDGSIRFCDQDSTNHPSRFYRIAAP